jgi:signal transduction histidine kinase
MVISANGEAIFPLEAYEVEVDDYILMPISPAELWRRVSQCLEDKEVVELQPLQLQAESSWERDQEARPQMMLMLHDIRGSMVSAAASLKLMVRGSHNDMSETTRSRLQEVSGRVENLIHLTDDFFSKTLGTTGPAEKKAEIIDLRQDIVEPVLTELAADIRDHKVTLENRLPDRPEDKIPVRGSKSWLKSVFRNLINNGIRYGGSGCTIIVDFENQGANCRLNVYNTGQTVPEAYRSMLFTYGPGMRRSKKGRKGLGLGLPLSRDILQNHGGDIWYEPGSDGSKFVVSLPQ